MSAQSFDPDGSPCSDRYEGEYQGSWIASPASCDVCLFRWVAVYPEVCLVLECSNCGHMTRAPHLVEQLPDDEPEPWQLGPTE